MRGRRRNGAEGNVLKGAVGYDKESFVTQLIRDRPEQDLA